MSFNKLKLYTYLKRFLTFFQTFIIELKKLKTDGIYQIFNQKQLLKYMFDDRFMRNIIIMNII